MLWPAPIRRARGGVSSTPTRSRGSVGACSTSRPRCVPYLALLVAMFFALRVSVWLSLVLVLPTSAFLVRTFIVFHDCTHGSFMRSRRANDMLGAVLGLARVAAVPRLAARACGAPCDRRRPRPAWSGRRRDADRRRVPGASCAAAALVPALPQPAGHVRHRLAPRARAEAALRAPRGTAARS